MLVNVLFLFVWFVFYTQSTQHKSTLPLRRQDKYRCVDVVKKTFLCFVVSWYFLHFFVWFVCRVCFCCVCLCSSLFVSVMLFALLGCLMCFAYSSLCWSWLLFYLCLFCSCPTPQSTQQTRKPPLRRQGSARCVDVVCVLLVVSPAFTCCCVFCAFSVCVVLFLFFVGCVCSVVCVASVLFNVRCVSHFVLLPAIGLFLFVLFVLHTPKHTTEKQTPTSTPRQISMCRRRLFVFLLLLLPLRSICALCILCVLSFFNDIFGFLRCLCLFSCLFCFWVV